MNEAVKKLVDGMDLNPPTTEEKLQYAESKLHINFPDQYREFMLESDGVEGGIGEYSYVAIWSMEEIVQLNEDYDVNKYTPGLVYFGSDGGDEAFAFDSRTEGTPIVMIPFSSIHWEDLIPCGNTFQEFLQYQHDYVEEDDEADADEID